MINFPGLHLSFNINRIAFNMFGINIYWYAICIVFAIVLSITLCIKSNQKFGLKNEFILETFTSVIIFGVIGTRAYYVLFNLDYYLKNPVNMLKIRDGGLAIYGGIIAGSLVIIYKCKKNKINPLDMFDLIAPYVALSQAIGRWGNFFNMEAYGVETKSVFRMGINTVNRL